MDSCSVMRVEKSRLETRVREVAPHLIDIDGDSCHHIHNFVKKMTSHFGYYLEGLFCDIPQFSAFCDLVGNIGRHWTSLWTAFSFVVTCWLLVLGATLPFSYMLNVYMAYYNSTCIHNARKELNVCKREHKKHKTSELEAKLVNKEKNVDILVKRQARIYANNYIS